MGVGNQCPSRVNWGFLKAIGLGVVYNRNQKTESKYFARYSAKYVSRYAFNGAWGSRQRTAEDCRSGAPHAPVGQRRTVSHGWRMGGWEIHRASGT